MSYRLNFIFLEQKKEITSIKIEVSNESDSKTLSPFIRKIDLNALLRECTINQDLVALLNHSGALKQPFCISKELIATNECVNVLRKYNWLYIQKKINGTIKKVPFDKINIVHNHTKIAKGLLLRGELFISNVNNWHKNIDVRFIYDKAITPIIASRSTIPFISKDHKLFYRDLSTEESMLVSIKEYLNEDNRTISLPKSDIKYFTEFQKKGWDIYVIKDSAKPSKIFHHSTSGIEWFSTDENDIGDDFTNLMLDGFLKNRNYCKFRSSIAIFSKKDALKLDEKEIATAFKYSSNTLDIFSPIIKLTYLEKHELKQLLNERVKANIRSYQLDGIEWLATMDKNKFNCMLADDMGLGKTLQTLSFIAATGKEKTLIVAPTTLIQNWKNEITKFVPQLGEKIEVISYDMLRLHIDKFKAKKYDLLVIDEAQIIKNRNTQKFHSVGSLNANRIISLTGTPIENSVNEIWSHFFILHPPTRKIYERLRSECTDSTNSEIFAKLSGKILNRFILRRTKNTVLKDLPPKIEKDVFVELSEQERNIYNQILSITREAFRQGLSGRINSLALESLLRLRQCCVSINLLPSSIHSGTYILPSKLDTALGYVKKFTSDGSKVLIFSQFVGALTEMRKVLDENKIRSVTLDGHTAKRSQVINEFETNSNIKVFLISLKAGGVGLNLTAANSVILLDDWWNPAVEDQAMSRAHRIGQTQPVSVVRLICSNTVEEKIVQLQMEKKASSDIFLGIRGNISMKDIQKIIS